MYKGKFATEGEDTTGSPFGCTVFTVDPDGTDDTVALFMGPENLLLLLLPLLLLLLLFAFFGKGTDTTVAALVLRPLEPGPTDESALLSKVLLVVEADELPVRGRPDEDDDGAADNVA